MRIGKGKRGETKVDVQMTPMIDVVFQLLVFFLFSFKIIPVEGEIGVNMPPITAGAKPKSDEIELSEKVKIKLRSSEDGALLSVMVGENQIADLPGDDAGALEGALRSLTEVLRESVVGPFGQADDAEVEIDADRSLVYRHVIEVTNAVQRAGIKKINFTDPLAQPQPTRDTN